MTNDGARACPGAPAQLTPGDLDAAAEIDRLTAAYPVFRFRCQMIGHHGTRWVAERRNGLHPGLHTVITDDLAELHAALTSQEGSGHAR